MNDNDLKIMEAMDAYGGNFVKALAQCAKATDEENLETLKTSFGEIWIQYAAMSVQVEQEGGKG